MTDKKGKEIMATTTLFAVAFVLTGSAFMVLDWIYDDMPLYAIMLAMGISLFLLVTLLPPVYYLLLKIDGYWRKP